MSTWMVTDAHGNALTDGLQGPEICDEARQVAQSIANRRGESVWLSPSDDSIPAQEIEPETEDKGNIARAKAAGYYVREGSYTGTADDRLGRWYFGHEADVGFRPYGAGHPSQRAAWEAALEHAEQCGRITMTKEETMTKYSQEQLDVIADHHDWGAIHQDYLGMCFWHADTDMEAETGWHIVTAEQIDEALGNPPWAPFILCRSDAGDGGWSLHAPGSSDDAISSGDAPYLVSGVATWDPELQKWDRPDASDYAAAAARWKPINHGR